MLIVEKITMPSGRVWFNLSVTLPNGEIHSDNFSSHKNAETIGKCLIRGDEQYVKAICSLPKNELRD